ncbi:MAG: hypothetical protein A3J37_04185 [Alphaproteobacteria bacterium RIFCSPHIGHO2_12_FULL_45_9]|nr:MAG: hypothetical protein A3B66_08205 [Alphaproteobacteria bacterium RIFCSPHIGHO2_02_FULL_46_13]OFW95884.1 MAG: hypothetical protein A3J37_04185 [Alphaproteobacteria bacterium RIFCSPHIGHO2_12_FULL_45_9]
MPTLQETFSKPSLGPISVPDFSVKQITLVPYRWDKGVEPSGGFHLVAIGDRDQSHILATYGDQANKEQLDKKVAAAKLELIPH